MMWPLLKISEAITYDSLYPANFSKSLLSRSFSFTQIPFPLATDQIRTSLVVQAVKKLPAMQETGVRSLVRKIPSRRKWQLQYSCLENPWTEEPGRLQSMEFSKPEYWSGYLSLFQGIFPTRDQTQVSCIAGGFLTSSATREAPKY